MRGGVKIGAGERFGSMTVMGPAPTDKHGRAWCMCRCDCGKEKAAPAGRLRNGAVKTCGCGRAKHATKHGLYGTPEHKTWRSMLARCGSPGNHGWRWYGGRGIVVCEWWRTFENFLADMGPKPSPGHTIDRINSDGNYESSNCRWATWDQQVANRRPRRSTKPPRPPRQPRVLRVPGEHLIVAAAVMKEAGYSDAFVRSELGLTRSQFTSRVIPLLKKAG